MSEVVNSSHEEPAAAGDGDHPDAVRAAVELEIQLRRTMVPVQPPPQERPVADSTLTDAQVRANMYLGLPVARWAQRYLGAVVRHATSLHGALGDEDSLRELEAAEQERRVAMEALTVHRVGLVEQLDAQPLRGIVERFLTLQRDRGIDAPWNCASDLIAQIAQDRDEDAPWQTLYLIAIRVFEPWMDPDVREHYEAHRQRVAHSIKAGEGRFIRAATYDRLLALLFPDLSGPIHSRFGVRYAAN